MIIEQSLEIVDILTRNLWLVGVRCPALPCLPLLFHNFHRSWFSHADALGWHQLSYWDHPHDFTTHIGGPTGGEGTGSELIYIFLQVKLEFRDFWLSDDSCCLQPECGPPGFSQSQTSVSKPFTPGGENRVGSSQSRYIIAYIWYSRIFCTDLLSYFPTSRI